MPSNHQMNWAFIRLLGWGLALLPACGSSVARQPAGRPPTPANVSVAEPGGDADDPHRAALLRQLGEPWGRRDDKDGQVEVPLPDWEHWKRVRFWLIEHFAGWRYGKDHHAMAILLVQDVAPGEKLDSLSCLRRFETWTRPQLRAFEVKLGKVSEQESRWRDQPIIVRAVDGHVNLGFSRHEFSAAWTAYAAYPDACLVYAMAVPWDGHEELAKKVRDRWLAEAFQQVTPLTPTRPYRKPR